MTRTSIPEARPSAAEAEATLANILRTRPWRSVAYGIAYFLRRWMTAVLSAVVCAFGIAPPAIAVVYVSLAVLVDVLCAPKAVELRASEKDLVEAVVLGNAAALMKQVPGNKVIQMGRLALGGAPLLLVAACLLIGSLGLDAGPILLTGAVLILTGAAGYVSFMGGGPLLRANEARLGEWFRTSRMGLLEPMIVDLLPRRIRSFLSVFIWAGLAWGLIASVIYGAKAYDLSGDGRDMLGASFMIYLAYLGLFMQVKIPFLLKIDLVLAEVRTR